MAALLFATSSLAFSPTESSCSFVSDTDYDGSVIKVVNVATGDKQACCTACSSDSSCTVGVLFGAACYLKDSSAKPISSSGRTACVGSSGPPPPPPPPPPTPTPTTPGHQHPSIGFPDGCNINVTGSCAPTYDTLQQAGVLWPCPADKKTSASTWPTCAAGEGSNPLCTGRLNESCSCCCPAAGCYSEPLFNTVIGVCKGASCACGGSSTRGPSCAPQGEADRCGSVGSTTCTGESVACCMGSDVERLVPFYDEGTHAKLNYLAAFEYDTTAAEWVRQNESSFNADGELPTFDLMQQYGGLSKEAAWLAPQPGGSVFWSLGYYAAGVRGVGVPGAMFVLSTEEWWGGTWYMLNQVELDRGPAAGYPAESCPTTNDNCWASGNAGEMDFLEPDWSSGRKDGENVVSGYRASYSTQVNQIGRQFVGGVNGGGFSSSNYLLTAAADKPEPVVYVAVVDSVGNWVYRLPADEAEAIWLGIGRKSVAPTVRAAPKRRPAAVNPCTDGYCVVFTSNCQATTADAARAQGCGFNGDQGFCGNWFARMADTKQPLLPSDDCTRDVRGGATMPWCAAMVNSCTVKAAAVAGGVGEGAAEAYREGRRAAYLRRGV